MSNYKITQVTRSIMIIKMNIYTFPNMKASENPTIIPRPTILAPPCSYTSGIMDSPSMTRIAPAANDKAIASTLGSKYEDSINSIAEEIVPKHTATVHKRSINFLLFPRDSIPSEDDSPSGKLEMKMAAKRIRSTDPPIANELPSAIFSGILSISEPTSMAVPETPFPPPASVP
jgi:hypothetical protein